MAALVPLAGARLRRRHRRGIAATSDTGEEHMDCCITLPKRGAFSDKKMGGKRKRSAPRPSLLPELMEEIVIDILVRLPVKSLVRCTSVSKAWRAIISDPAFIQAHLRHSTTKWEQNPRFIITPHTLDCVIHVEEGSRPVTFSNHIRFYQWHQGASNQLATFIHAKDFGCEFDQVHHFVHCDGLVLVPTNTRLYVFNPATRESTTLPRSDWSDLRINGRRLGSCHCTGLGLDPRTGKYKVFRAFYWSMDRTRMGMEVFTIASGAGSSWRYTRDDLPYPAERCQSGVSINGFIFWRIDHTRSRHLEEHEQPFPRAILHLRLDTEEFGVTGLPDLVDPDAYILDVLPSQELCLTACSSDETMMTIWTLPRVDEEGLKRKSPWEQRYSIPLSGLCHPMALPPCSGGGVILWKDDTLYRYDVATHEVTKLCEMDSMRYQGRRARKWKNLFTFNAEPYTESLVRITDNVLS